MTKLRPGITTFHTSSGTSNINTTQSFTIPRHNTLSIEMWSLGGTGGKAGNSFGAPNTNSTDTTCPELSLTCPAGGLGQSGSGDVSSGHNGTGGAPTTPTGGDTNTPGAPGQGGLSNGAYSSGGAGASGGSLSAGNGGQGARAGPEFGDGGPCGGGAGAGGGYLKKTYTSGTLTPGSVINFHIGAIFDPGGGFAGWPGIVPTTAVRVTWS